MLMCVETPSSAITFSMTDKETDIVFSINENQSPKRKKAHLSLNDLKKIRDNSSSTSTSSSTPHSNTITPTQIYFPRHVTEEQEAYVRGFSQALENLYKREGYPTAKTQSQSTQFESQQKSHSPLQPLKNSPDTTASIITSAMRSTFPTSCCSTTQSTTTKSTLATSTTCDIKPSIELSAISNNINTFSTVINQSTTNFKNNILPPSYNFQQSQKLQLSQQQKIQQQQQVTTTTKIQPAFISDNFQSYSSSTSSSPHMNNGCSSTENTKNLLLPANIPFTNVKNDCDFYSGIDIKDLSDKKSTYSHSKNYSHMYQSPTMHYQMPPSPLAFPPQKPPVYTQLQSFNSPSQSFSPQNQSFSPLNPAFLQTSLPPQQQLYPSSSHLSTSSLQLPSYKDHSFPSHSSHDSFLFKGSSKDSQGFSSLEPEEQEKLRLERKRAKNRIAAQKCQLRKLERISTLENKVCELRERNKDYKERTEKLRSAVEALKATINSHVSSGCRILSHSAYSHNDLLPFSS